MGLLKGKAPLYIGLDIKNNVVRFVEIKRRDPLEITRYGERALPASIIKNGKLRNIEGLESVLMDMFSDFKINKQGIIYTALNQNVVIRKAKVPLDMKEAEIRNYLFLEIGDSIQLPFENPVFDIMVSSDAPKEKKSRKVRGKAKTANGNSEVNDIYVVATAAEPLNELANLMKAVKQVPVAVDLSSLAYQRIFQSKRKKMSSRDATLLLEVDGGTANFTIFENDVPVYTQYEDYNPNHWVPAPSSAEEVDWLIEKDVKKVKWDEVFSDEDQVKWMYDENVEKQALEGLASIVNNVLYFYSSSLNPKRKITNIILTGDNPLLSSLVRPVLKKNVEVPIELLKIHSKDRQIQKLPNQFYLALGLAMKEV